MFAKLLFFPNSKPVYYTDFFISLCYLNTLFTESNLSWLIHKSIKALEIKTLNLFLKTLFYYASSFSLQLTYTFLIPAAIPQIFISTAELVIPTRTQTYEANAEIETQPVTVETKISKCST